MRILASCCSGHAHKTADVCQCGVNLNWHEVFVDAAAEYAHDALAEVTTGQIEHDTAARVEREGNVGVGECYALKLACDVGQLCLVGL